ncbi:MAG: translation initiation factor IF-2 [Bacteroidales bacterium]|jgi:translation initiation factor IF-2|nr:translation initiation factor IF-2 [Bacteroidales bacterium]MCI2121356.1 translation initiation factor IF-2 [Bacteroidales bacterium]MCI2145243.1 translation initiation factor IF-2 [Bacteroidales bacterium]
MTEEKIRVNKVLREFNIGMRTLFDFLKQKGFEVEESPNAKISMEAYDLIKKEFKKEQDNKEKSIEAIAKYKQIAQEANGTKKEEPEPDQKDVEENVGTEVLIKTTSLSGETRKEQPAAKTATSANKPEATPEAKPAPKAEELPIHKIGVKIVGKLDMERKTENIVATVEKSEPESEKAETRKEIENIEKPVTEIVEPQPKAAEPKPTIENTTVPTAVTPPKPAENKINAQATPKTVPNAKQEMKQGASKRPGMPQQQPRQQSHQQKAEHRPEHKTPQYIKTEVTPLRGVKTVGTIDLSKFENKRSQNSGGQSQQSSKKGKRERIHKPFGGGKVDVNAATENGNGGFRNKDNRNNRGNRDRRSQYKQPLHAEVNEEEIQKQIKETYARLTENKGKTKGAKRRHERREEENIRQEAQAEIRQEKSKTLDITEFVTVNDIATLMGKPVTDVINACMNLGLMVSINQRLDAETLELVADEFGFKLNFVTAEVQNTIKAEVDHPEDMTPRPPVVTVMGHVDHGKTSLLDFIRKTNVIAGEAGGITQHIGAYNVVLSNGRRITFLDTPGHEAFTAMRARGAKITDMAIIIIAADDAVMPQTIEAISHAQAAGVPMIFAINKMDKPGAQPEKIKEQLANMNLLVEDWGGKYQCQEISAKKGTNVDKLLEKVLLEADMLELKANPGKNAVGTVIESSLDKGRGYLATVLVQGGTLHTGDVVLSGSYSGRVKAMFNERGQKIDEAGPSTPASVLGLNGAPAAGDKFNVMDDEREAREIANKREQLYRIQSINTNPLITLDEIGRRIAIGNFKELSLIVKGDVDGSVEALSDSLIKLSTKEIQVKVILKGVGAISESDVQLAIASNAIIIGFQVRPSADAKKQAEQEHVEIRLYSVIYDAINEVKSAIEGMLAPEEKEVITGNAEVKQVFHISKIGAIAGCMVKDGKISRGSKVHVIRDGIVVFTGILDSLKRMKDDAKEVNAGYECGLTVKNYNEFRESDVVEAYNIVEVKRKL